MKILTVGCVHGNLPTPPEEEFDLLAVVGDICPNWSRDWLGDAELQLEWSRRELVPWLERINSKHKIITLGNHDGVGDRLREEFGDLVFPTEYIIHGSTEFMGYKIAVSAYTINPGMKGWAFPINSSNREKMIFEMIQDDTQILLTHSPSYGVLDHEDGNHYGSKELLNKVKSLKNLKLHVHSHVHDSRGRIDNPNGLVVVNTALGFTKIEI